MRLCENTDYLEELCSFIEDSSKVTTIIKRKRYGRDNYLYLIKSFIGKGILVYGCEGDNEDVCYKIFNDFGYEHFKLLGCYTDEKFYCTDYYFLFDEYSHNVSFSSSYENRFTDLFVESSKDFDKLKKTVCLDYINSLEIIPLNNDEWVNGEALRYYSKGVNSIYPLGEIIPLENSHKVYLKYLCGNISLEDYYLSELDKIKDKLIRIKSEDCEINKLLSNPENIKWDKCKFDIITALRGVECKSVKVFYLGNSGKIEYDAKIEKDSLIRNCLQNYYDISYWEFSPKITSDVKFENITKITFGKKTLYEKES